MMKRWMMSCLVLFVAMTTMQAQNVQLHYDFGRHIFSDEEPNRQKVTLTLEHFKADKWGSWFYFVDVDMSRKFTESAYLEISREFKFGKQSPFSAHVEYNGGLNRHGSFQQAALVGAAWNGHVADFSKTWSVQLLYKQYFKSYENSRSYASVQLTGVWKLVFAHKALTFSGFVDLWRGENAAGHGQLVFLTEPQLWYNLNTLWGEDGINLSVGTEWEMSNNFIFNTTNGKTFFFNPTLAVKWTF
jgi:hypothetical protein